MARKLLRMPSLSRVAAGAIATLELPIGPTYRRLIFSATGTGLDLTDIGRIDVLVDGKVVQTYKDLTRLVDINSYYKRGADTFNQFAIHFERAELLDAVWRRAPGMGTADVQTFHVQLNIVGAAPVDLAITCHAEVDPQPMPLGLFFKIREYPFSSAVSGDVEIDKLPRGPLYSVVHLFKADVNAVEVTANQVKVFDGTKAVIERTQKEASPVQRLPITAKATHIDFIADGDLAQSLDTSQLSDFRVKMTLGTSGAVDIVAEVLDTLQGV
jgi:hypothetical protein